MANAKPTQCCVKPMLGDPSCDFTSDCSVPASITLTLDDRIGTVAFERAIYNGSKLTVEPKKLTFTLVAGRSNLDVVFAFSDPANGKATLKEECAKGTALIDVDAREAAVRYHFCVGVR